MVHITPLNIDIAWRYINPSTGLLAQYNLEFSIDKYPNIEVEMCDEDLEHR